MMIKTITFVRNGHDEFIDFIKAYAIICVLVGHTFPYKDETGYSLWYGMQVPLFILIQVFHVLKRDTYRFKIRTILIRILIPFFLIQLFLFCIELCQNGNFISLIVKFIARGGFGPGAYYPWIYLQMALFLLIIKRIPNIVVVSKPIVVFLVIIVCEVFEIILSLISLPDFYYRLLAIRYLFLILLGWIWVRDGIVINNKTILLSLLSMAAIIFFEYYNVDTEPWFYNTAWKTHRWPCYYYVSTLLCALLFYIYTNIKSYHQVEKSIRILSKCSYEIFLLQMLVIQIMPKNEFVNNSILQLCIKMILVFTISIFGGFYFNLFYNRFVKK